MQGRTLQELIKAELDAELGQAAAALITMCLNGSVVTLYGDAVTPAAAKAAERAALRVPGVARVVMMIEITPGAGGGEAGDAYAASGQAAHTGRVNDWISRAAGRSGRRP